MRYAVWPDDVERRRWIDAVTLVASRARNQEKRVFFWDWRAQIRFRHQAMPGYPAAMKVKEQS